MSKRIPVIMVRDNLDGLPEHKLPDGFHFRRFRRGEERVWAEIQTSTGPFESVEKALEYFSRDFGPYLDEFEDRCIFVIEDATGRVVGTTTAWYSADFQGLAYGQIHWVAVIPEFQGRKLAKPMLAEAMRRLKQSHTRAFLHTNTGCERAIGMYLDFGFVPARPSERFDEAWSQLARVLEHPVLDEFLREGDEPERAEL